VQISWENRVVIVTGASSGIGAALALALGRCGARVGLMARREAPLRALAKEIEAEGSQAAVAICDVRDRDQVRAAFTALEQALGPTDVLIANAGLARPVKMSAFDLDRFAEPIETNLLGAVNCVGAVLPGMVERGRGQLVGISSAAGMRGLPGATAYSASKAGLTTLLEGLRVDLVRYGVAVTCVVPGFVDTESNAMLPSRPFLVSLERAVVLILRGVERRRRRVEFPWPVLWGMRLSRLLPDALWDWMLGGRRPKALPPS